MKISFNLFNLSESKKTWNIIYLTHFDLILYIITALNDVIWLNQIFILNNNKYIKFNAKQIFAAFLRNKNIINYHTLYIVLKNIIILIVSDCQILKEELIIIIWWVQNI
jgi:hypothetical protein